MPENPEAIKKTYDAALGKLQAILFSLVSTSAERKAARTALNDLTATMLAQNLKTVEGRTALLSALIVELRLVTDGIKPTSKIADIATDITALVGKAHKLFKSEKKGLLAAPSSSG